MAKRYGNKNDNGQFEDIYSFNERSDYQKANRAKKGSHKVIKTFICIISVLLILIGGGLLFVTNYLIGDLKTNAITKDKAALGITSEAAEISDPKVTNIALFGVDSRGDDFSGRSDVIMVLTIDEIHKKIKMCSILRDIRVYMGEDYNFTDTGYDKLNHAYAFGGPEYAIKVINQNYNLDIQDYVTVNFNNLAKIIDSVGGVDVEITEDERIQINDNLSALAAEEPEIGISESEQMTESGMVHMDGNQAVAFSRIRAIDSDNARASRQQTVLSAVMNKAKTMSVTEYPGMINKISGMCETSLDAGKIMSYIPFAVGGFSIDNLVVPSDVEGYSFDYMENGGWMWTYDVSVAADHIRQFIYGDGTEASTTDETGN